MTILILAALASFPLYRRLVREDAVARAAARLCAEAEASLCGSRISRGAK